MKKFVLIMLVLSGCASAPVSIEITKSEKCETHLTCSKYAPDSEQDRCLETKITFTGSCQLVSNVPNISQE